MTWMLTAHGRAVDLMFLAADQIAADDIAHHLAQINRYTGACKRPYSVAEHSLLVADIVERELGDRSPSVLLAALMHDAHEAYTQDLSGPMKQVVGTAWRAVEDRIQRQVLGKFGLHTAFHVARERIHWADMAALATERAQLLPPGGPAWQVEATHQPVGWVDLEAQARFGWADWRQAWLDRFHELQYARRLQAEQLGCEGSDSEGGDAACPPGGHRVKTDTDTTTPADVPATTTPLDEVVHIPVDRLVDSPMQHRRTYRGIDELAASMRVDGVLQPITVRPANKLHRAAHAVLDPAAEWELVFGHRRLRAARAAGLATVPAFARDLADDAVARMQLVENVQRDDVNAIEEGEAYAELMQRHGVTVDELVRTTGKSRSHIYARITLTRLVPAMREKVLAGEVGSEVALLVARLPSEKLQLKALEAIARDYRAKLDDGGRASYRAVRDLLREKFSLGLKGALFKLDDAELVPAAGACNVCPKRSGCTPELFNDIVSDKDAWRTPHGADVCTDPDCFDAKKRAQLARQAAELTAKGQTVVTGNKARAAIGADGKVKGDWVPLTPEVKNQLAKAAKGNSGDAKPQVVTIQNPRDGKTVKAVKVGDLQAAGVKVKAPPKPTKHSWEEQERKCKEQEAKARAAQQAELQVRLAVLERVRAAIAATERCAFDLRMVAELAFQGVGYNGRNVLIKLHGGTLVSLTKKLDQADAGALALFLLDCVLCHELEPRLWQPGPAENLAAMAQHYGIDAKAVRAELTKAQASAGASTPSPAAQAPKVAAAKRKAAPAPADATEAFVDAVKAGKTKKARSTTPAHAGEAVREEQRDLADEVAQ